MPVFPSATEGPYPMHTNPPADQQPMDLEGALAMVQSILFRDGGMDQRERDVFQAWVQNIIMQAQAQAAEAPQDPAAAQGLGESSADTGEDYNPFGGTGGSEAPGYEGEY